jgi:chromosome segregation ATPase
MRKSNVFKIILAIAIVLVAVVAGWFIRGWIDGDASARADRVLEDYRRVTDRIAELESQLQSAIDGLWEYRRIAESSGRENQKLRNDIERLREVERQLALAIEGGSGNLDAIETGLAELENRLRFIQAGSSGGDD